MGSTEPALSAVEWAASLSFSAACRNASSEGFVGKLPTNAG